MISRNEFISTALDLFDKAKEVEDLSIALSNEIEAGCAKADDRELSTEQEILIRLGKAKLYEDCASSWRKCCDAWFDEDGVLHVTSYEGWIENKIYKIPDYMSRDQFMAILGPKLHEEYARDRDKAIAELNSGSDDDE